VIRKLNHVAIAVPDLDVAVTLYRTTFGAKVSDRVELPEQGVTLVFVEFEDTKVELMEPLGEASPIGPFLERNISGGIHHICYEVSDMHEAIAQLQKVGMRILDGSTPSVGAHGKPVVFLHPKDNFGTLVELEEA
jgi:methylmalonyl-CoA/ethylmalonyl-CoA epimerase